MESKGVAIISGVIFLAITITAIVIIYQTGIPFVQRVQSAAIVEKIEGTFIELNSIIKTVASEGLGSQRTVTLRVDAGEINIDSSGDSIAWSFDTDALIISPRTSRSLENLRVGSNLETITYETQFAGEYAFAMENEHLVVYIKKIGSQESLQPYNTQDLLLGIHNKDIDKDLPLERLEILFDEGNAAGSGYTLLEEAGRNLPFGTVTAFMDPDDSSINYNIHFILESGADFLTIRGSL